ncbi:MAG: anhydro-N-acetylmuramic acid kinase [Planctomycetota bacterium]
MVRYAIGCMTGTSLDGLDAVLVEAEGEGLGLRVRVVDHASADLGTIGAGLRALCEGEPTSAHGFARLATELGALHASVVGGMLDRTGVVPSVCALPGQTVVHAPPISMQMIDPWPVALRLGCPVVHDLRGADVAAGGQGAPITPIADWVLFRSEDEGRVIVNLGGFCNVTTLPAACTPDGVGGFDVCACNQLLDACARVGLGRAYDEGGEAGLGGTPEPTVVDELLERLRAQSVGGRSLGSGDALAGWAEARAAMDGPDLVASAACAVGTMIGERVRAHGSIVLAGGGSLNAALVRAIEAVAGPTVTTAVFGVGVQQREAACVAVLGLLALDGVVYTRGSITGRERELRCEGSWIGVRP